MTSGRFYHNYHNDYKYYGYISLFFAPTINPSCSTIKLKFIKHIQLLNYTEYIKYERSQLDY